MKVTIFTDGGSRGNPGLAGIGAVIKYEGETKELSQFIGNDRTNNEAEYEALIFALKNTKKIIGKAKAKKADLKCYSDSELMVRQLNHKYKIKEKSMQVYFVEIWNLMLDFNRVEFFHIPREENKRADMLANKAMDEGKKNQKLKVQKRILSLFLIIF